MDYLSRARELSKLLTEYQRAYYVTGRAIVSDMEYDRLFTIENEKELKTGDRVVYTNAGGYTLCLSPLFIRYFPAVYI